MNNYSLCKPYRIKDGEQTVDNECLKVCFDDGCVFFISSNENMSLIGECKEQVIKFTCGHGDEVSFILDAASDVVLDV